MKQIPAKILAPYELLLFDKESLPHFIQKLRHKKQNNQQQRQASDAISLYYEIELSNSKNEIATKKKYTDSTLKKDHFKLHW